MYADWPLATLLLLGLAGELSARTNYRSFFSHQKLYPPETTTNSTANNDIIAQWDTMDSSSQESPRVLDASRSQERERGREREEYPEVYASNAVREPMLQEELSTVVSMLTSLSTEMSALRGQMSNLKYQNHILYKQLKRMNNRCMTNPAPLLRTNMCPKDFAWNEELQKCFKFGHDRITWRMAREKCRAMDSDLISIANRQTQQFVSDTARKSKELRHCDFWIGATDSKNEKDWRWTSNDMQLIYANWNHNEPNNGSGDEHCAMMLWVFNWSWNDARCKTDNACYVCETTLT